MQNPPNDFKQFVINNNEEIFSKIQETLSNAENEILIASAWFTDTDLFDVLKHKINSGVKVAIVIGENQENNKLPFEELTAFGGRFLKIKSVGYGIMHQKFCVVDNKIAIHGSYNYTINARKNNHESVIYTTHKETVETLAKEFEIIYQRGTALNAGLGLDEIEIINPTKKETTNTTEGTSQQAIKLKQFEDVLKSLVEAEVSGFNRIELYNHGKNRSESCNGDHNVIKSSLDTIYYNFINDIDISEEKKTMLITKIKQHNERSKQLVDLELQSNLTMLSSEITASKENTTRSISELNGKIDILNNKIDSTKSIEIPSAKNKIVSVNAKIHELNKEYLKPKHKYFEFIPYLVFTIVLFTYLLLFYSSAAYILIYSERDANTAILDGVQLPEASVFVADAIPKAFNHGFWGGLFVLLFLFVPLSFTQAHKIVKNKLFANFLSYFVGLFIIDFLVAVFVSKSISQINFLTNKSDEVWDFWSSFKDINFYLVFVLGGMALLIFKFIFDKFLEQFEARNPTYQSQQAKLDINKQNDFIKEYTFEITELERTIELYKIELIETKQKKGEQQYKLDHLPIKEIKDSQNLTNEAHSIKEHFDYISNLYSSKVENNNPRISTDALKDRINTFLEGWNDQLHSYFAITIAIDKSIKASDEVLNWLETKLKNNLIDTRLQ